MFFERIPLRLCLVGLLFALACCGSVHRLDMADEPVWTVRARLPATPEELGVALDERLPKKANGEPIEVPDSKKALWAAVVWAGYSETDPICQSQGGDARIKAYCPPDNLVATKTIGPATPIGSGLRFEVSAAHLPPLAVGPDLGRQRLVYGSLMVFMDLNGNEALDHEDAIIATSWHSDEGGFSRLAYREGDPWRLDGDYYPLPASCPFPSLGFSWLVWDAASDQCRSDPTDEEVQLRAMDAGQATQLECSLNPFRLNGPQEPPQFNQAAFELIGPAADGCLDEETWLAAIVGSFGLVKSCVELTRYLLQGCDLHDHCWDYTLDKPEWWPC